MPLLILFTTSLDIFINVYYGYFNEQYTYLYLYVLSSFILTLLLFLIAFMLSSKKINFEKSSSYECGFEPFGNGHLIFNIQFFIVGFLFMLFDLELAYIFPWIFNLGGLSVFCYFLMVFFIFLLIIGFVYEWKKGALDWI